MVKLRTKILLVLLIGPITFASLWLALLALQKQPILELMPQAQPAFLVVIAAYVCISFVVAHVIASPLRHAAIQLIDFSSEHHINNGKFQHMSEQALIQASISQLAEHQQQEFDDSTKAKQTIKEISQVMSDESYALMSLAGALQEELHAIIQTKHSLGDYTAATEAASPPQETEVKGSEVASDKVNMSAAEEKLLSNAHSVIHKLSTQSSAVETLINKISLLSEQTHLIAINATLEAVKAGKNGENFAAVADEIRGLAQETQQATGNIKRILDEFQAAEGKNEVLIDVAKSIYTNASGQGNQASSTIEEQCPPQALPKNQIESMLASLDRHLMSESDLINQLLKKAKDHAIMAARLRTLAIEEDAL